MNNGRRGKNSDDGRSKGKGRSKAFERARDHIAFLSIRQPRPRTTQIQTTSDYIIHCYIVTTAVLATPLTTFLQFYLPTSIHSSTPQGTPKHSVCPLKMLRGPTSPQFLLSQIHRSLGGHFVIELSGVTAAHRRRKFESGNCVRDRSLNFSPSSVSPSTLHAFARTLRASTMIPS